MSAITPKDRLSKHLFLRLLPEEFELFSVAAKIVSRSLADYLRVSFRQQLSAEIPVELRQYLPCRTDVLERKYLLMVSPADRVLLDSLPEQYPGLFVQWVGWRYKKTGVAVRTAAVIHALHLPRQTQFENELDIAFKALAVIRSGRC